MSREIKYRAYHKTLKIVVDVLLIDWLNELVDLEGGLIEQEFEDVALLQYTGLKDKNGVEIYEGDYIITSWGNRYKDEYRPVSIYKGVVRFGEYEQDGSGGEYSGTPTIGFYGEFTHARYSDGDFEEINSWSHEVEESLLRFTEIEIVGNIYENPERLEREAE